MNKNDLGLDGSTPQTVTSESCPELFERVGKIMGVDVESCTLKCDVSTIVSETVRGNHETYTYLVTYMDAVIDGVEVIYENGTYSIASGPCPQPIHEDGRCASCASAVLGG